MGKVVSKEQKPMAMTKAKEADKPDTIYVKDPELSEYERMKSFLLWTLGIVGGSVAVIVAVSLYFTYGSINDLKTEVSTSVNEMKSEIKDLNAYASGTLEDTELKAEKRLDFIERQAEVTAMLRVQELFMTNRIQDQFEFEAKKVFDKKLEEVADEKIKELSKQFSEQLSIQPKLQLAVDKIRAGDRNGLSFLDSLIENSNNEGVIQFAILLRNEKSKDYENSQLIKASESENAAIEFQKLPQDVKDKEIEVAVENILNAKYLDTVCIYFIVLRTYSGQNFKMFDFKAVEDWYKKYKRQMLKK